MNNEAKNATKISIKQILLRSHFDHNADFSPRFIKKYVEVEAGDDNLANAIAITPVSVAMQFVGTAFQYKSGKVNRENSVINVVDIKPDRPSDNSQI